MRPRRPISGVTFARFLPWLKQLAVAVLCLCVLTSCLEKLKEFLPKPPPPAPPPPVEAPLSAEEERLQQTLENGKMFAADGSEIEVPKAELFELNKSALVSIMCYHDFAEKSSRSDMVITATTFRTQMQALKDAKIPVIPLADVLAWKRGEKNIPEESVVITMDDGWLGVHEYCFPILKEFNYPFTVYLYKNYVNRGGRSLTLDQIREMMKYGAELGSHSVSHQALTARHGKTDEQYHKWLEVEIVESKKFLEETFGVPCRTFAYPYGNKSDEIAQMCLDAGYEAAVTVNPQKTTWDTPNGKLPRFVQIGDKDVNFRLATNFRGGGGNIADSKFLKTDEVDEHGNKLVVLQPQPGATIADRRPLIEANLARVGPVLPDSLALRVSGFGLVPVEFDPATQTVRFRVPQMLRLEECTAQLSFRRASADKAEVLSWKFKVDQSSSYQPAAGSAATATPPPAPKA
ncbi:polysaccharide deacetylase family protein [Verrucomicrobium spinosum]|uniref:polysaccharide deacetylase family protein n=1 Tax=Verrucomicrobium spinosum TaxID=2736 RepID=UPI0001744BC9|nr:polysaccharide deacetylase family protein [Verrucomicrobium spinosum]